jgi:hypothetical protein
LAWWLYPFEALLKNRPEAPKGLVSGLSLRSALRAPVVLMFLVDWV